MLIKSSYQNKQICINQGRRFRTVPASMAEIFHTGAYTGIEMVVFCTGFNTGRTGTVLAIPG